MWNFQIDNWDGCDAANTRWFNSLLSEISGADTYKWLPMIE